MPLEWKILKNYKDLKKTKNNKLLKLYSYGKWFIEDTPFTLK